MSESSFSGLIDITRLGPTGMVTLRADLADAEITETITSAGFEVPGMRQKAGPSLWMSPDEVMILTAYESAEAQVSVLQTALKGKHSFVVNVSDARTAFHLKGPDAVLRDVLAKLTPADLRPDALSVGEVRRTRLAQVAAAFWFEGEGSAQLICFRSVSDYVFELLKNAAAEDSAVGYF